MSGRVVSVSGSKHTEGTGFLQGGAEMWTSGFAGLTSVPGGAEATPACSTQLQLLLTLPS